MSIMEADSTLSRLGVPTIRQELRTQFRAVDPQDRLGRLSIALLVVCSEAMQLPADKRQEEVAIVNRMRHQPRLGWLDDYMQCCEEASRLATGVPDVVTATYASLFFDIGVCWSDVLKIANQARDSLWALESCR